MLVRNVRAGNYINAMMILPFVGFPFSFPTLRINTPFHSLAHNSLANNPLQYATQQKEKCLSSIVERLFFFLFSVLFSDPSFAFRINCQLPVGFKL